MIIKSAIVLISILFLQAANASQEGVLPFSKFEIKSGGIGSSGPVTVTGKKNEKGNFITLSVQAFEKTIQIPQSILNQIPFKIQNGIQLSYEGGYKELGGKTIYLQLQVGFTSGSRDLFIIVVKENGTVGILPK
jgi:hypothetical protein